MKLKMFSLFVFLFLSSALFADNYRDELMWREAYKGNFSIVHKLALSRKADGISDEILNQFVIGYVYYRMHEYEQLQPIFKGIDDYLEHMLINRKNDVLE